MKILRKLLNPFEKLFGKVTDKSSYIERQDVLERTFIELMKLMELHYIKDGYYIKHWSTKPLSGLIDAATYYTPQEALSIVLVQDFDELIPIFGVSNVDLLIERYDTPDSFIDHIRERLKTEKPAGGGNEPKYDVWFKANGTTVNNKEFKRFIKAISLCLSGQLRKEDLMESYWEKDIIRSIDRTKVKLTGNLVNTLGKQRSVSEIKSIIVYVLSGYTTIDYTDKI